MKRRLITLALLFVVNGACVAQNNDLYKDSKPASTNVPGVEFPRVDSHLRAIFRVEAPNAQKVQVDLLKVYDMVKDDDGVWTVTTDPLPPGFHYYFFLGIGSEEGQRMKSLSEALKKAGINNTYFESEGTAHEWLTWRRCLHEFAPLLFKE